MQVDFPMMAWKKDTCIMYMNFQDIAHVSKHECTWHPITGPNVQLKLKLPDQTTLYL